MNANAIGAAVTAAFIIYLIVKGRLGIYLGLLSSSGPTAAERTDIASGASNVVQFPGVPNLTGSGSL